MIQDLLGDLAERGAAMSRAERDEAARDLSEKCGYAAAALTILPIPLSEVVAVMPLHVGMVVGIGNIYGADVTRDSAQHLILRIGATVGLSLIGSRLATTAAKVLLPGLGGLISAPFMYASTIGIGTVARIYFENQGQLSDAEIKSLYNDQFKQAKQRFDPSKAKSGNAQDLARAAAAQAKDEPAAPAPAAPTAAAEGEHEDPVARLERLKALLEKGLIEQDEYDAVKRRILDAI
ncbi:MAG: DUF697 domain-containing protein [Planctomycetota bacterium]